MVLGSGYWGDGLYVGFFKSRPGVTPLHTTRRAKRRPTAPHQKSLPIRRIPEDVVAWFPSVRETSLDDGLIEALVARHFARARYFSLARPCSFGRPRATRTRSAPFDTATEGNAAVLTMQFGASPPGRGSYPFAEAQLRHPLWKMTLKR